MEKPPVALKQSLPGSRGGPGGAGFRTGGRKSRGSLGLNGRMLPWEREASSFPPRSWGAEDVSLPPPFLGPVSSGEDAANRGGDDRPGAAANNPSRSSSQEGVETPAGCSAKGTGAR